MNHDMAADFARCVSSLQASSRHLDSSIAILDSGVRDFPRTKQVVQITRVSPAPTSSLALLTHKQHFELISEPALFAAQSALANEIGPEVEHLLHRVEQHLAKMERREKGLISKSELQEGRIQQTQPRNEAKLANRNSMFGGANNEVARAEKLKMLRNKRERLEHTLERLSLQASHKVGATRLDCAMCADVVCRRGSFA